MPEHKVIGYAAALRRDRFFAHGGAMLLAGDENILRGCIESTYKSKNAVSRYKIRKIRYGEIMLWLNNGIAISFDEITYNRFAEHAIEDGEKLKFSSFPQELKEKSSGVPVIRVKHK
jgi:lipoate-protein ligase A